MTVILFILGLGALILGAEILARGSSNLASAIRISPLIIGLTIVAFETSSPELAVSVQSALSGKVDISLGNVVGSNIFNILAVLGLSGLVAPDGIQVVPAALKFDIPFMVVIAVVCLPIFFTGSRIARWEGFLFMGYYAFYTIYLILASSHHNALPHISFSMKIFVIPLAIITLLVSVIYSIRTR